MTRPILTRGERLQVVQRELEADRARQRSGVSQPGPSLTVRIVDALRDAEIAAGGDVSPSPARPGCTCGISDLDPLRHGFDCPTRTVFQGLR